MTEPLRVGDRAPDFELRDQHGGPVRLSSAVSVRPVVLVFYPWAFSRVCGNELRAIRDNLPRLHNDDSALLAVSCDPVFSLRAYAESEGLGFPLLSDHWPHGAVASAYGVFDPETGAAARSTFVIGRGGTIAWAVHNAPGQARNVNEYARVLENLIG